MLSEYNSLYELLQAFPTEESCIKHLEVLRWPRGVHMSTLRLQSQDLPSDKGSQVQVR